MPKKSYYITTAIAYTSKTPHIGNTYEAVLADSIARYHRLAGDDVWFQTGTDEHGQKIQQQAIAEGMTPKAHVDKIAGQVRQIWDLMDTSYDHFIRTTDAQHEKVVQKIFKRLYDQGDVYKGSYEGWYCTPCESFYTESQLVDGCCPECGEKVQRTKEEAYFLKLTKYQDRLIKHIEEHPDFIQPESRKNEMMNNFLKPGLQDLCVSRTSFDWGIPVTFDEGHVTYVWIDALSNYITGIGYDPDGSSNQFRQYWPADVHIIGKDILRFHTIYWPIMLMALDIELPKQIFGHPWLMVGDSKMSKSKGNVIYAEELVNLFGVDAIRYFLLHEMPFAQDGTLTYELLIQRINSDLANILGNLVNRTIAMSHQYFEGQIMSPTEQQPIDQKLIDLALATPDKVQQAMEQLKVADAMDHIWTLLRRTNKYIDETTPWVLAKEQNKRQRLATVLYHLLEAIRFSAVLLQPFMPKTAEAILNQLQTDKRELDSLASFDGMVAGQMVKKGDVLFARIDEKKFFSQLEETQLEKASGQKSKPESKKEKANKKEENKESVEIGIDDFAKVHFQVGHVKECRKHPKADRLLVSQIQIGDQRRQIVSGIAESYTPEEMVGKQVVVVTNLKPVKLRGERSEGMILCATNQEGGCQLVTVEGLIASGATIS